MIFDNKAQAGGLFMVVGGIFLVGIIYVAFGTAMNFMNTETNVAISDPGMNYSQGHRDSMDTLFKWWWAFPIISILIFAAWGIKNGLDKEDRQI